MESTQIRWFVEQSEGSLALWEAAKDAQKRVGKQLYEAKGPTRKAGIVTVLKGSTYPFSG